MNTAPCGSVPRLSEAKQILPAISGNLDAATSEHPHCATLELWPIVEEGLFGYELVPEGDTHTYVIVGRNASGEPSVRTTSYSAGASSHLQLVAVNGRTLSRKDRAAIYQTHTRDEVFSDWRAAASAACARMHTLFPHRDRHDTTRSSRAYRYLEHALYVADSHLERWDPLIEFFGLPNEAQLGFPLIGSHGKQGELMLKEPDIWLLHWHAPPDLVIESWSITPEYAPVRKRDAGLPNRRARRRRATDRGEVPAPWSGQERRHTAGRRLIDRKDR